MQPNDPERAGPHFSILLPTHNRDDVLPFAIGSVLAQTCGDFELLIVGDGCTDRTAEVVTGFADPRIRWFDLPKGPGFGYANRNLALREARGDLIAFMAHDDLWLPDHLALLGRHFANPAIDLAYSRPLWVTPDGMVTPTAYNLYDPTMRARFLDQRENHIPSSCVAHRRSCLERVGYWDESLPRWGDWDMWSRIIKGGKPHNLAYEATPTALHYRAIWKEEATAYVPEVAVWRELRRRQMLPPTIPAVPVSPGLPEQETTWRALSVDPVRWTRSLRDAIDQAIDRCLDHAHLLSGVDDKDRHIRNLDALIVQRDQHIVALDDLVAAKDRELAGAATAHEQQVAALAHAADEKDHELAALRSQAAELAHGRAALERELADVQSHLAALAQQLAAHERHIARIEGRLPLRLYRRVRRFLP